VVFLKMIEGSSFAAFERSELIMWRDCSFWIILCGRSDRKKFVCAMICDDDDYSYLVKR